MTREAVEQRDQEETGFPPASPIPCSNGCGYFGSSPSMTRCSKCYADYGQSVLKSKTGAGSTLPTLTLAPVENLDHLLQPSEVERRGKISPLRNEGEIEHSVGGAQVDEIRDGSRAGKSSESLSKSSAGVVFQIQRKKVEVGESSLLQTGEKDVLQNRSLSVEKQNPVTADSNVFRIEPRHDQQPATARLSSSQAAEEKEEHMQKLIVSSVNREQGEKRPPTRNLCQSCRKRVGLTGFKCRCGKMFCAIHRYSDKHSCTYDYKLAGRDAIAKANPLTVASKVVRI